MSPQAWPTSRSSRRGRKARRRSPRMSPARATRRRSRRTRRATTSCLMGRPLADATARFSGIVAGPETSGEAEISGTLGDAAVRGNGEAFGRRQRRAPARRPPLRRRREPGHRQPLDRRRRACWRASSASSRPIFPRSRRSSSSRGAVRCKPILRSARTAARSRRTSRERRPISSTAAPRSNPQRSRAKRTTSSMRRRSKAISRSAI